MLRALLNDKWTQGVALCTTILAVSAAISSLKGGGYSTKIQLNTTLEVNRWSYFQAKSIKQHSLELQHDEFALRHLTEQNAEAQKFIEAKLASYDKDIARYNKEKDEIKADAERLTVEEKDAKQHGGNFGMAVMLLQIAIMLSSVSALTQLRWLWHIGLFMGAVGLFYMANGFFLFF